MKRALVSLALVCTAAACGNDPDPLAETFALATDAVRATSRSLAFATIVYGSATISVIAPHDVIAGSIRNRLTSETGGCATIGGTGAQATMTTPATGCTLASAGMEATGTFACTVKDGPDPYLQIACDIDATVDTLALSGTLDIFTEMGNDYRFALAMDTVRGNDTTKHAVVTIPDLSAGIAAQSSEASGSGTIEGIAFTQTGVKQRFNGCYPQDGTMDIAGGLLTFSSTTQSSGLATFTQNGGIRNVQLPTRPGCPSL